MIKKNILIGLCAAFVLVACEEQHPEPFSGRNEIVFYSSDPAGVDRVTLDYYWSTALDPNSDYDTCWVDVATVGNALPYDRELKIVQDTAVGWDLVYDHVGNVVDSVSYILPNQAVAGRDFMPLDSEELKSLMVMPANEFRTLIPVVMIRDNNRTDALTLQIRLVNTPTTQVGDPRLATCLITIQ